LLFLFLLLLLLLLLIGAMIVVREEGRKDRHVEMSHADHKRAENDRAFRPLLPLVVDLPIIITSIITYYFDFDFFSSFVSFAVLSDERPFLVESVRYGTVRNGNLTCRCRCRCRWMDELVSRWIDFSLLTCGGHELQSILLAPNR